MIHALLHDATTGWLAFGAPVDTVTAGRVEAVLPAVRAVAERVEGEGLWAVGSIAYEAAPGFDPALAVHPPAAPDAPWGRLPLLAFTLHTPPETVSPAALETLLPPRPFQLGAIRPSVDRKGYLRAIRRIRRHIGAGNTYQVNYTLRLEAPFEGDPRGLFREMVGRQPPPYAAYLEVPAPGASLALCSASPELFFRLEGGRLTCRPMKGTAGRGRTLVEDEAQGAWLAASAKNRAENLMIVDMVRNDLGRIAVPGSVEVPALFEVERFPSVWQMTSTVTARARGGAGFAEILAALFPCASITGAPKARTSQIITELETGPRGTYTGAIGYLAPGGVAQMNVAIRTVEIDRHAGRARYGVGGGIVWDSVAEEEYRECQIKALALPRSEPRHRRSPRDFELLETLLWEPEEGFFLLHRHLARLRDSALYFAFAVDLSTLENALQEAAWLFPPGPQRVRLRVDRHGTPIVEATPLDPATETAPPIALYLAKEPIDANDPFLFHKTTHRQVYEDALQALDAYRAPGAVAGETPGRPSGRACGEVTQAIPPTARPERRREPAAPKSEKLAPSPRGLPGGPPHSPGGSDVLLWNAAGEVTETTTANIVVELDGRRRTPPVECGLLAGTFRAELLERGEIEEGVVRVEDLPRCEGIWLINSVRRWRRAELQNAIPTETCTTKPSSR